MTIRRAPLPRLAMLAVLLAGLGGLAVLTRLSVQAHQLQQRTARSLAAGLATRVADRYGTDLQGQLYVASTAILNRAGLGRMGTQSAEGAAKAILAALPEVARCKCASQLRPRYAFSADLRSGTVNAIAPDSSAVTPPPLSVLREELAERASIGGWEFAVSLRLAPGGVLLFFTRVNGAPDRVAGFAIDTAEVRYRLLQEVDERRGAMLVESGLAAVDSQSLSIRVQLPDSTPLAMLRPGAGQTVTGSTLLPRMFGGWRITAGLTEAMAAAAVGAPVSRSPLLLLLVLATLAALAMLVAWVAAQRAADLAAMRATLITGMSHELRTPLTEILLVGESIQRGQYRDGRDIAGAIDVVVREAHRLLGMISNVLQISMTGGSATRVGVPQPLGDEVQRVVEDFRGIATGYQCSIAVTIRDDAPVSVDLDAVRQILNNFLDNACRYGGPGQEIAVELSRHAGAMRLTVRDQGPGIPAAHLESVWQPFVRGPQPEGRERFGSGIGLAVARQLAESMHGRTGVIAHDGPGTMVYLEFDLSEKPT